VTADVHFVQGGDAPALIGVGEETLTCECGNVLIEGFQAAQFLGLGIQCARCGAVTATAPLPEGKMPPAGLSVAELSAEPRVRAMKVPHGVAVVGRAEMDRLGTLLRPNTPADTAYCISAATLDEVEAIFECQVGGALPVVPMDRSDAFVGIREYALAWAVRHLRGRVGDESWRCMETAPTSAAVLHITGFLHFVASWSRHPLFPVMVATAGERGFSLHGLALFAAAHSLAMMRNRTGFRDPIEFPARIESFELAVGPTDVARVHLEVFDRFEFPYGRAWTPAGLGAAVSEVVEAAQGRINLRNPGLLLLSPGLALLGYDEALIEAVKAAVPAVGRKNRGMMAVAVIALRIQPMPDPHTVRFGYLLYPVGNRHYSGDSPIQVGA
jgi:hypothetical protein